MKTADSIRRRGYVVVSLTALALLVLGWGMPGHTAHADTAAHVSVTQNARYGPILTDSIGWSLYVLSSDSPGVSTCTGDCAVVWPRLQPPIGALALPAGVPGTLTLIMRPDGTQQVAHNGMPLYYFSGDKQPGDTNGQGVHDRWGTWSLVNLGARTMPSGGSSASGTSPMGGSNGAPAGGGGGGGGGGGY